MKKIYPSLFLICLSISLFAQQWENPFFDVYQLDSLNIWIVGDNGTIINTKDGGNSWNDHSIDTTLYFNSVCFNTSQNGYILGKDNYNIKTMDGGESWDNFVLDNGVNLYSMFFLDEDYGWVCAGNEGLYKTSNGGNSWTHYNDTIGNVIFFDSLNGFGTAYKNLLIKMARTWDGGLNWTELGTVGNAAVGGGYFRFADLLFGIKVSYAAFSVYYGKTSNGGQTWTEIENIPGGVQNVEFLDNQNAWFGHSCLINYSGDFFETYNTFQLSYDNDIYKISVKGYSNGWAIGEKSDDSGCIWKLIGVNEWVEILPAGIHENSHNLIQLFTYPNPVKNVIQVKFETDKSQEITISIFNHIGKEIKTLFSGKVTGGVQKLSFDLNEFSDGSYLIQVKNEKSISVKKIIKI